jgi:uncharacterized membrane-anchored protein
MVSAANIRRVVALTIAFLAAALVVIEVAGIVGGLHTQQDGGTVEVGTIVVVQGVLGGIALVLAIATLVSGARGVRRRRPATAGWLLAFAVLAAAVWAVAYTSAYGS